MVISNKVLSKGEQVAQTSGFKKEQKKNQYHNHNTDFKQPQGQIHNPIKHQN